VGDFTSQWGAVTHKRHLIVQKHITQRILLRSAHPFLHAHPSTKPTGILCFQWAGHYLKLSLPVRVSAPHPMTVLWVHLNQHLKWHWISSASFAALTAERPYILQWVSLFLAKLPLLMGGLNPHLIRSSLSPPEPTTQIASQSVHLFLQVHN